MKLFGLDPLHSPLSQAGLLLLPVIQAKDSRSSTVYHGWHRRSRSSSDYLPARKKIVSVVGGCTKINEIIREQNLYGKVNYLGWHPAVLRRSWSRDDKIIGRKYYDETRVFSPSYFVRRLACIPVELCSVAGSRVFNFSLHPQPAR